MRTSGNSGVVKEHVFICHVREALEAINEYTAVRGVWLYLSGVGFPRDQLKYHSVQQAFAELARVDMQCGKTSRIVSDASVIGRPVHVVKEHVLAQRVYGATTSVWQTAGRVYVAATLGRYLPALGRYPDDRWRAWMKGLADLIHEGVVEASYRDTYEPLYRRRARG